MAHQELALHRQHRGERAADFLTLVSSAVRKDLDVWAYIKDVLDQLLAGSTNYHCLRPDLCKESHPETIRTYRTEERRDRADRMQIRRSQRRVATRANADSPWSPPASIQKAPRKWL